jgi:uncharacterized protein YndB with AHSA1/START domain
MPHGLVSQASIVVQSSAAKVWEALVTPEQIKQYMFGTTVTSDWKEGSPITWAGEYQGKKYVDKGRLLQVRPQRVLQYSHFSPLSGKPDVPENYHTVTIELAAANGGTRVTLSQDNNPTEEARGHTAKFWQGMLETLKKLLEA